MTKRIIDGKVYDTDKANEIASYTVETLYLTPSGSWFFVDYTATDNPRFKPVRAEKACDWLYDHSKADEIKTHFPNRITDA